VVGRKTTWDMQALREARREGVDESYMDQWRVCVQHSDESSFLTEHHTTKAYSGSGAIAPRIL
jgi:hypothetical protein